MRCSVASSVSRLVVGAGLVMMFSGAALGQCGGAWLPSGGAPGPRNGTAQPRTTSFVTLPNGDVILRGEFTEIGGVATGPVARWNGTTWSAFPSGLTNVGAIVALSNSDLVAVSKYTSGTVTGSKVSQWNGTSWVVLGGDFPPSSTINDLAVLPNGDIVAVGDFTSVPGGGTAAYSARWNGTAWVSMGAGLTGAMQEVVAMPNGDAVAFNGAFYRWTGTNWTDLNAPFQLGLKFDVLPNGTLVASAFNGGFSSTQLWTYANGVWQEQLSNVSGFPIGFRALPNGRVWFSSTSTFFNPGTFLNDQTFIIREWNGTQLTTIAIQVFAGQEPNWSANDFAALPSGEVAIAGRFDALNGVPVPNLAKWNGTTFSRWQSLGLNLNGTGKALLKLPDGSVIVGGGFAGADDTNTRQVARFDGTDFQAVGNLGLTGSIESLTLSPSNQIVACGRVGQDARIINGHIFTFDGTSWTTLGNFCAFGGGSGWYDNPRSSLVRNVAYRGTDLFAVGEFASTCVSNNTPNLRGIAQLVGATWTEVGGGLESFFLGNRTPAPGRDLVVMPNSDVIVGGAFQLAGGQPMSNIARWDGSAWSAVGAGLADPVIDLELLPNGDLLAITSVSAAQGPSSLQRWDGTQWHSIVVDAPGSISRLRAQPDGSVLVTGNFTSIGGANATNIARLSNIAAGGTWQAVAAGANARVNDALIDSDGTLLIAGDFSRVQSVPAVGFARFALRGACCDSIDFNNNGVSPEDQDVIDFFNVLAGAECPACNDIDFNNNTVFPEDQDVIDFFNVLAGGTC